MHHVGKYIGIKRNDFAQRRAEVDATLKGDEGDGAGSCCEEQRAQGEEERLRESRIVRNVRCDDQFDARKIMSARDGCGWGVCWSSYERWGVRLPPVQQHEGAVAAAAGASAR